MIEAEEQGGYLVPPGVARDLEWMIAHGIWAQHLQVYRSGVEVVSYLRGGRAIRRVLRFRRRR